MHKGIPVDAMQLSEACFDQEDGGSGCHRYKVQVPRLGTYFVE
jgi:hypothetical protein